MSLVAVNGAPIRVPMAALQLDQGSQWTGHNIGTLATVDAASERFAWLGKLWLAGGATGKTFSSAGAKIHWAVGTAATFANAGTTLRVGLQDTTQASALIAPDNTFDTYDDLVGGTDTITANTINTVTMSSGTKTISTGDKIAVVFDMTARAGVDSVRFATTFGANIAYLQFPGAMFYSGGAWSASAGLNNWCPPWVLIECDDGTLGILEGGFWYPAASFHTSIQSSSNPDEFGATFVPPFACTLYGVEFPVTARSGAATGTKAVARLCSGALASPTLVEEVAIDGFDLYGADAFHGKRHIVRFATPRDLTAGTRYSVLWRATSTMLFDHMYYSYPAAGHLFWQPFGTDGHKVTREGDTAGTGALTAVTTDLYPATLLLSKLSDNASSGGGSTRVIGG